MTRSILLPSCGLATIGLLAAFGAVGPAGCSVNEDGTCVDDSTCPFAEAGADVVIPGGDSGAGASRDGSAASDGTTPNDVTAPGDDAAADGGIDAADTGPVCDPTQTPAQNACVISDALAIFVSPTGSDATGAGTMEAPVATIARGVALASASSTIHRVLVCAATYAEAVVLGAPTNDVGLGLFGGVTCPGTDGGVAWAYTGSLPVVAPAVEGYALTVTGLTNGLHIEDIAFDALDASTEGASSVAALFAGSANVTLTRVSLSAGDAAAMADSLAGTTPTTALPVPSNGSGGDDGGAAVVCNCDNSGAATSGGSGGTDGGPTSGAGGNGSPDLGAGRGGQPGACFAVVDGGPSGTGEQGGSAPLVAPAAGAGTVGALGAAGWTPSPGAAGSAGAPGQGGGGGNSQAVSGVGGGGACGGCGGSAAMPGQGGGASIAALAYQSTVAFASCVLTTGDGESGGAGATGQSGAAGGLGGNNSGGGCPGGAGGAGGTGAASGGGAGGVSVGVVWNGTKPTLDTATQSAFVHGAPGAGGVGGASPSNDGVAGVAQVTYP